MQLFLAWVGAICLTATGLFLLGMICGEWTRSSRVLRERETEIDVRPRVRPFPPRHDYVLHHDKGRVR